MEGSDELATASAGEAGGFRRIIEATPNAMLIVDGDGRLVLVNERAEALFGYDRAQLLRMHVEDLIPHRYHSRHLRYRTGYLAEPDARPMGAGRDLFGMRSDGSEVPIEIGLNPLELGGERFVLASVIDISERLAAQAAIEAAGQDVLRRSILTSMPCVVIVTDVDGLVVTVNSTAETLLGYREEELVGVPMVQLRGSRRFEGSDWMRASADGEERERTYRRKDGVDVPVGETISPMRGASGDVTGYLVVGFDITKRLEERARVDFLANHDALTGLPNRSMLIKHLLESLLVAQREGTRVALLLLDVDHFKRVNDTLGHPAGDQLLLRLTEVLGGAVGPGDLVARLGGDEFVIVVDGVLDDADLARRIEAISAVLPAPVVLDGQEFLVTASIGAAVHPQHGSTPSHLLKHADIAMYRAKAAGRNNVQVFETGMLDETNEKVALSVALAQALEGGSELSVVYQPQVDLRTGRITGLEALARWESPTLGRIPPDRFIPVAEEGGLIGRLGAWVLRRACEDFVRIRAVLDQPLRLAVNVSPRQFTSKAWLAEVREVLADSGLDPTDLELEITEGTLMDDHHDVLEVLHGLKELGVRIVVDDFGQGYSSLAYLTRFPVNKLKIDRAFVWRLASTGADAAIVDAILAMAVALSLQVVAEGVETEAQEDYLRRHGCDEGQGYLYSAGVSAQEFVAVARTLADGPAGERPRPVLA